MRTNEEYKELDLKYEWPVLHTIHANSATGIGFNKLKEQVGISREKLAEVLASLRDEGLIYQEYHREFKERYFPTSASPETIFRNYEAQFVREAKTRMLVLGQLSDFGTVGKHSSVLFTEYSDYGPFANQEMYDYKSDFAGEEFQEELYQKIHEIKRIFARAYYAYMAKKAPRMMKDNHITESDLDVVEEHWQSIEEYLDLYMCGYREQLKREGFTPSWDIPALHDLDMALEYPAHEVPRGYEGSSIMAWVVGLVAKYTMHEPFKKYFKEPDPKKVAELKKVVFDKKKLALTERVLSLTRPRRTELIIPIFQDPVGFAKKRWMLEALKNPKTSKQLDSLAEKEKKKRTNSPSSLQAA